MLEESNVYFYSTPKKKKGWIFALCIWTKRKTLVLDTPGPPFVCFKPTESKSIHSGCSKAQCPCSRGDLSRPRQRTERHWVLRTAEKLLLVLQRAVAPCHNYPVELSLFQEGRLRVTNHNMTEFPCCPRPWKSADEVCRRHQGFWFMTLLLTLSKSIVFIN